MMFDGQSVASVNDDYIVVKIGIHTPSDFVVLGLLFNTYTTINSQMFFEHNNETCINIFFFLQK